MRAAPRQRPAWLLATALLVIAAACAAPPAPSDATSPAPAVIATRLGPDPSPSATARCPPRPFDTAAPLGLEFAEDIFVRDESHAIAQDLLGGLAAIYADPATADVCRFFTERGWTTALAFDRSLRAVDRGELILQQDHVLRVAFEGDYDLRDRPPIVPLDIVYDIPAGAVTRDLVSGETRTSTADQRTGFHADIASDGHRWRVDRLGPIGDDNRQWLAMPTIPPPGPPCTGFVRDSHAASFDEDADRLWCDADGRGRKITDDQLVLLTRYPCEDGRAAILHIGRPLGAAMDPLMRWEYVRDPLDEFLAQRWLTGSYDGVSRLPKDAAYTGWTNGNIKLWISPSELDQAIYVVRGYAVERWPRAAERWGVIDCN
jgi:hypothetical protein